MIGGAALAVSGILLQTLTKNPLADSGILGINTGAGFVIAIMIGLLDISNPKILAFMPFLAMIGSIITICTVYAISHQKNQPISPSRLIIAGVGVSSLLSGMMISIIDNLDIGKTDYIVSWLSGKVTGGNWQTLMTLTPLFLLSLGLTYWRSYILNMMMFSEETTIALGINIKKERLVLLILSTALASLSVILVGNITFIGLLSGHITKQLFGNDHRITLPASMIVGMILILVADTIGRSLLVGTGIPTGIIISVIGAPYFLYLMIKAN
ncbi:iron chelate uptake ABC transporter, FeCT family, permease protein [Streptococcus equinus ATCC 9812]|uniref:Iron chelate uptake ABC transporter, FeCT family, permease protein n=2 Tax=Streptococcus equinus TaxID=1335 RepID=E8JPW8_STREI|nr:iron chelate uptake ABC transporter, FeCT family, permease protein [Streptococcus equinus ATCC 9812]